MKEKLWNANYIKVMTTNFLLYFAFYLLTPLLPLYLSETFGATKDVIGIVLSGYTVAALIIRPFSGYVVDGFSRKKVLNRWGNLASRCGKRFLMYIKRYYACTCKRI